MRRSIIVSFLVLGSIVGTSTQEVAPNRMEPRIDRPGGDYRNFSQNQANPGVCGEACANDPQCSSWTYANPGIAGRDAVCFLKNVVPQARRNDCCTSGVKVPAGNPSLTVVFENTGFGPYEIYLVNSQNAAAGYVGGVAAGATTVPLPTRPGDVWEFRVPAGRTLESYTATNQVAQMRRLNGYRLDAAEPSTSFLRRLAGDIRRWVEDTEREVASVSNDVSNFVDGTVERLEREGKQLSDAVLRTYGREIDIVSEHLVSLVPDLLNFSRLAQAALERGDHDGVAQLLQLDTLIAKLQGVRRSASLDPDSNEFTLAFGDVARQTRSWSMPAGSTVQLASYRPSTTLTSSTPVSFQSTSYVITFSPLVGDISLLFGGTYEAGIAWPLTSSRPPASPYTAWSWSVGVSAGADASVAVGIWFVNSLEEIGGPAHGVTFGGAVKGGLTATFWWTYDGIEFGQFLGLTVSPQFGVSAEVEYVRGTTDLQP